MDVRKMVFCPRLTFEMCYIIPSNREETRITPLALERMLLGLDPVPPKVERLQDGRRYDLRVNAWSSI